MKEGENSCGVAAVVLGILSITISSLNGVVLGIIGLAFALKQKKVHANAWSKWGKILNSIGIIVGVILFITALWFFYSSNQLPQAAQLLAPKA